MARWIRLAVVLAAVTFGSPPEPAVSEEPETPQAAVVEGLAVRILPPEGKTLVVAAVGRSFELRYELVNRRDEPLLLPLAHPAFARGTVRYVDPYRPGEGIPGLGGRGWGPAPSRQELVELAPGEHRIETLQLVASSHGPAAVDVDLTCWYEGVAESALVPNGSHAARRERRVVAEPRLWHGTLTARAPLEVVFTSAHGPESPLEEAEVARLWRADVPLLDRLDLIDRMAVLDPSSRAVDALRAGFGRVGREPAWPEAIRYACAKQLAIAAHRGYGWRGLATLLRVGADDDEAEDVRCLALEGLQAALVPRLHARTADCTFDLAVPEAWQARTKTLFDALAKEEGKLAERARSLLAARPTPRVPSR